MSCNETLEIVSDETGAILYTLRCVRKNRHVSLEHSCKAFGFVISWKTEIASEWTPPDTRANRRKRRGPPPY